MSEPAPHRLVLLRHAKSDWPAEVDDLDRPLSERGVRDATVAGPELATVTDLDAAVCSPARRTRQTWQLAGASFDPMPPTRIVPELYGAGVDDVIDLLRTTPETVRSMLVIGHEPTMSSTAQALAGPGSDETDLARLREKYPTGAIAIFSLSSWAKLARSGAALQRFVVPRA